MTYAFDWDFILRVAPRFGVALLTTLQVFLTALAISTSGAVLLALIGRSLPGRTLRWGLATFSWLFRGLPELIVLLFAYLALPQLGLPLPSFWAAVCGLALIGMAYEYEIFRGALNAVPGGQFEAARALGLGRVPLYARVILPQVLRVAVTPYVTFACSSLKRTSVASAVAVPEIMGLSRRFNEAFQKPFELMLIALVLYAALSSLLMVLEHVLDSRLQRGLRAR
ncbi:amino acid ABC transporter permease [Roseomonas elaeocarpi]|uniref:Amino acid ABC transporter permease n=1 Tax=Roseomonas elaeocarpi TaxID=907779 RepID=A0ABV6JS57_9PROT